MSPPSSAGPPSQSVTTPPACLDDRDQRDDVVGLQPDLDDEVDMAGRNHRKGVAVGAVAGEPHRSFPAGRRRARRSPLNSAGVVVHSVASASAVVLRVVSDARAARPLVLGAGRVA